MSGFFFEKQKRSNHYFKMGLFSNPFINFLLILVENPIQ